MRARSATSPGAPGIVTPDDPLPVIEEALRRYDIRWLVLERDHLVPALGAGAGAVTSDRPGCRHRRSLVAAGRAGSGTPAGSASDPAAEPAARAPPSTRSASTPPTPGAPRRERRAPAGSCPSGCSCSRWSSGSLVIPLVSMAPTEGAAYYVGVAANLVGGHGLVSDAVWSYATPPQVVPKPAFELWLPMATFVAALPMAVAGRHARRGTGWAWRVLGALVAPLAWLVGREAAAVSGLDARRDARRRDHLRAAGGRAGAVRDGRRRPGLDDAVPGLRHARRGAGGAGAAVRGARARGARGSPGWRSGVALGLAYLSRQEAIWIAVALAGAAGASTCGAARPGPVLRALVAVPLARGRRRAGRGRALAHPQRHRPGRARCPARRSRTCGCAGTRTSSRGSTGPPPRPTWRGAPAPSWATGSTRCVHQLVSVLVTPAFPVGLLGLVAVVALRRSPALRRPTALALLLLGGAADVPCHRAAVPGRDAVGHLPPLRRAAAGGPRRGHGAGRGRAAGAHLHPPRLGAGERDHHAHRAARGDRAAAGPPAAHRGPRRPASARPGIAAVADGPRVARCRRTATRQRHVHHRPPDVAGGGHRRHGHRPARRAAAAPWPTWPGPSAPRWLVVFDQDGRYPAELVGPDAAACLEGPAVTRRVPAGAPVVLARIDPECTPP